jgi:phosphatidylserine/phosphatidylglycerophosphate/cardiolipin synthase-like enzyme
MTGGYHQVSYPCMSFDYAEVLSELQMRRPNKDKYRVDKLLERKAKEGVKIYVIL